MRHPRIAIIMSMVFLYVLSLNPIPHPKAAVSGGMTVIYKSNGLNPYFWRLPS